LIDQDQNNNTVDHVQGHIQDQNNDIVDYTQGHIQIHENQDQY